MPASLLRRAGALLTLLLLPGFVADGGSQVDLAALLGGAVAAAHHHAQAGLLEDAGVVVVGVAHGPAAQVALGLLLVASVDEAHVAVGPLAEVVEVGRLLEGAQKGRTGEPTKRKPDPSGLSFLPKHLRIKTGSF